MENQNNQQAPSGENTTEQTEKIIAPDKNEKAMSAISYIPLLFLIPFFVTTQKTKFLNFHMNQGLILTIIFTVGYFISRLLPYIDDAVIDIWKLITLIYTIIGIIAVYENKMKTLPIIGKWFSFIKY